MGRYLNPHNMTKEEWLTKNAIALDGPPSESPDPDGYYAVCLVDNGLFTAAALAFDPRELEAFTLPDDLRPKKWFLVTAEQTEMFN